MEQIYLLSAVLGLVIAAVIFVFLNWDKIIPTGNSRQQAFLIVGGTGSGKTSLFQLLSTGTVPKFPTVASQIPNEVRNFKIHDNSISDEFLLRDYPGNSKLINLYLYKDLKDKSFLKKLKGIIFVVDSSQLKETETVKLLFDVLNFTEFLPNGVDILVACNKQDLFQSKPVFKIKELLETEMNKLILNDSAVLEKIDDSKDDQFAESGALSSFAGKKFRFEQLGGNFDLIEGSVLKHKIDKWECWIAERAVN